MIEDLRKLSGKNIVDVTLESVKLEDVRAEPVLELMSESVHQHCGHFQQSYPGGSSLCPSVRYYISEHPLY